MNSNNEFLNSRLHDSGDFKLPEANFSDEEECKVIPQSSLPIAKSNIKEGRQRHGSAQPVKLLSNLVNKPQSSEETKTLDKYRDNAMFVMEPSPK